jgi:hypothetical protein
MSKRIATLPPWGEDDEYDWQAQSDAMWASLQQMRERSEQMRLELDALVRRLNEARGEQGEP